MIVCEESFRGINSHGVRYANYEIDFYAWTPPGKVRDHRLSLRKNLTTGQYEVYRGYSSSETEEIIFEGELQDALQIGDNETVRFHLFDPEDEACDHSTHP